MGWVGCLCLDEVHAGGEVLLDLGEGRGALGTRSKVEASTEGHQVSVVGGGDDGDGAGAAGKGVAQLVAEGLELVGFEVVIVVDDVVMRGTAGSLDTAVGAEEEVELVRVADGSVDDSTGGDVTRAIAVLGADYEEASVMTLLHQDESDGGGVVGVDVAAGGFEGRELKLQNLGELALGDTVTVEEDTVGEDFARVAEAEEEALGHATEVVDDLLAAVLDTDGGSVAGHLDVHAGDDSGDGGPVGLADTGMGNVSTKDDGGLLGDEAELTAEGGVDTAELDVDLEG